MEDKESMPTPIWVSVRRFFWNMIMLAIPYFLIELLAFVLLQPEDGMPLIFGAFWAILLASLVLLLPRRGSRIAFGISFYVLTLWAIAQAGYYQVFDKMMWLSAILYAGEGAVFLGDVIRAFPFMWWLGSILLLSLGAAVIYWYPKDTGRLPVRLPYLASVALMVAALSLLPELVFTRDNNIWGTRSEYAQSSSYRATYNTMYDAKRVYNMCGIYQLTLRDIWVNSLYPLTPAYRTSVSRQADQVTAYFNERPAQQESQMSGVLQGKNVILVLMESMDDWMITHEDTPTIYRMMEEGINFTSFYTPGYGSARTLNSEFCVNTGIYLPTTGSYVFDYVNNAFKQSFANQMRANGYSSEVFHYNDPDFYSRGAFEPALGYNTYNSYTYYTEDKQDLYNENYLFDNEELSKLFFREGQTFNTIITRSAHLSYKYNEVLSHYALKQYPEYRGKYGSEEEDCARVKAKLVDDLFSRLLQELKERGQLENTVIIAVTDHYTYGYKNEEELYAHSGVDSELLLEKTPCFVWSAGGPAMTVDKTLNTSDFLPTMLDLLGIRSPYRYLGQNAFDPSYEGYVYFPDGSWICNGIVCRMGDDGEPEILAVGEDGLPTEERLQEMSDRILDYIRVSNLLLTSNYYQKVR